MHELTKIKHTRGEGCLWCGAVLGHLEQCDLEFSQNYNCTASYFCGHICRAVYKMRFEQFEVGIFFKIWAFST